MGGGLLRAGSPGFCAAFRLWILRAELCSEVVRHSFQHSRPRFCSRNAAVEHGQKHRKKALYRSKCIHLDLPTASAIAGGGLDGLKTDKGKHHMMRKRCESCFLMFCWSFVIWFDIRHPFLDCMDARVASASFREGFASAA